MNCEQLLAALYQPHAADSSTGLAMSDHMEHCASCRDAFVAHLQLNEQMSGLELPEPPVGMEAAIAARIDALVHNKSAPLRSGRIDNGRAVSERWPWFVAALGAGTFMAADLGLFASGTWQPGSLSEHLLPGLVSDRVLHLLDSVAFTLENGVMAMGVMLVIAAFFRLTSRTGGLHS